MVLLAGQLVFTTSRSTPVRAAVALVFTAPAALAGYHAAYGLAHIVVPAEGWREAIAITGAIMVAAIAWARLTLSTANDAGRALPLA
jgi:hypothetical protein